MVDTPSLKRFDPQSWDHKGFFLIFNSFIISLPQCQIVLLLKFVVSGSSFTSFSSSLLGLNFPFSNNCWGFCIPMGPWLTEKLKIQQ